MKYDLKLAPETTLERSVAKWLREHARDYDESISAVMRDLARGGCASGMVGHLVYTSEAARFYVRHRKEIGALVARYAEELEWTPSSMNGWDASDPLALEQSNRNYLAWFAFEETARALCERAGWEG